MARYEIICMKFTNKNTRWYKQQLRQTGWEQKTALIIFVICRLLYITVHKTGLNPVLYEYVFQNIEELATLWLCVPTYSGLYQLSFLSTQCC
jgi:hypothetical protein